MPVRLLPIAALAALPVLAAPGARADAQAGAEVFARECAACHAVGNGAESGIGPHLNAILGRPLASLDGYDYSPALQQQGAQGLAWTREALNAYIAAPAAAVAGTRMNYPGLADGAQRADLIAYLGTAPDRAADDPTALPDLPPEVLALAGDPAWGEYLSAECTACHRRDGTDAGIPAITGWPAGAFVRAMHAYRQKLRPHPVMQMMAGRLSDAEIAALAAHFATLD
jgi:cytochrome c